MKAWNVKQMKQALVDEYLPLCQTATERDNCIVFFRIELRGFVAGCGRKLTPAECAILDEYGIDYAHTGQATA